MLLVAVGAGIIAAHVTSFALDETLIQQSAVHYTHNLPSSLFHDLDARATNRLYSLLLSIAFRLYNGVDAVRVDHVLSALLFVSAAIPVYLFARVIVRSEWAAASAAFLSIVVPWLTLTSAFFTENLSYPLFWWMVLACCRACWRPSFRNDALALLSIALLVCTRVQFAATFVGYVIALTALCLWRATDSLSVRSRVTSFTRHLLRGYVFALTLLLGVIAFVVYEKASGKWHADVERLLGTYSNVVIRNGFPPNMTEGLLVETIALALGVGLLPAIVSIPWYARRMARPARDRRGTFLLVSGLILVTFLVLTVYSQGGYLGAITEERYFFYVVPVFWVGLFGALEDEDVRWGEILACAVAFAALYGAIPFLSSLNRDTAFLAPAESVVPHVLIQRLAQVHLTGITVQDALAASVLVVGAITAVAWRLGSRVRLGWVVGAAVAGQFVLTGYAYAVIDGKVQGLPGRTEGSVAPLGWIDKHADTTNVTWLENRPVTPALGGGPLADETEMRTALFWNSDMNSWSTVPQLGLPMVVWPLSALPGTSPLTVNTTRGVLEPAAAAATIQEAVGAARSPFLQLAGTVVARSPDGALSLTRVSQPVRAIWLASGLQSEGYVPAGAHAHIFAFLAKAATPQEVTVHMVIAPVPAVGKRTVVSVSLGNKRTTVLLTGGAAPKAVDLHVCVRPGETSMSGTLRAIRTTAYLSGRVAGLVESVALSNRASLHKC
jgi:hypothetical protein